MNPTQFETLYKTISALTSKTIWLGARCDALEFAVSALARKAGLPDEKLREWIGHVTEHRYQKDLEALEAIDPSAAADVDHRKAMPDLPDEFA